MNHASVGRQLRRSARPVGWVAVIYAIAAVAAALMLSRQVFVNPARAHEHVTVVLDRADGIVAGKTEVRIAGVPVGLVGAKRLTDGRPAVQLVLKKSTGPLYRDATARVSAITPLQDMFVELRRGTRASGVLPDGGTIPASRTTVGADISSILDAFGSDQRARLGGILRALGEGLPDGGVRLRTVFAELVPLMRGAGEVTHELAVQRRALARLVHDLELVTGTLAGRDGELAGLVTDAGSTLNVLARRDEPLDETLRRLPVAAATIDAAMTKVHAAAGDLDPALDALRPAVRALPAGLRALEQFAHEARPGLHALEPAAARLAPLASTLQRTAGQLGSAMALLEPKLPIIDRFSATTVACLTPLQAFVDRFLSTNKLGSAKGTWWRVKVLAGVDGTSDPGASRIHACSDGRPTR